MNPRVGLLALTLCSAVAAVADEMAVFSENSAWETVSDGHNIVEGMASLGGAIYITDVPDRELFRISPDGGQILFDGKTDAANGLAVGGDGRLYGACMGKPSIAVWDVNTRARTDISLNTPANDLVITPNGHLFYTWGPSNAVWQLRLDNPRPSKAADLPNPNGISLSADEKELWVGEFFGDTVHAFTIQKDGRLGASRAAFRARVPQNGKGLLDGMAALKDGRLLVATALGVQILSTNSEAVLIPNPTTRRANYVRIIADSKGTRWMYVAHEKSVLRRKTRL